MKNYMEKEGVLYTLDQENNIEYLLKHKFIEVFHNDGDKFMGSTTEHEIHIIEKLNSGELLAEILSWDLTKVIDLYTKEGTEEKMHEKNNRALPYPLNNFKIHISEIIYLINLIKIIREFYNMNIEDNDISYWARAVMQYVDGYDRIPFGSDTHLKIDKIKDGATWSTSLIAPCSDEDDYDESTDINSEKYNVATMKEFLFGHIAESESFDNEMKKYPFFGYHLRYIDPIDLFLIVFDENCKAKIRIHKCKNCGLYFVPQKRSDTLYCNRTSPQDEQKSCKEYGAKLAWERTLKENEAAGLYRKIYMSKQMFVRRNPDMPDYKESFEKYKTQSKQWKASVKEGNRTEAEFIAWLKTVKEKKVL